MKNRNTILIVDDLEMNRNILSNIFKRKYNIVEASDGTKALEYLRKNSNDVVTILLDLIMPNLNGIDVLKTIKKEKIAEGVPIFVITADNCEEIMYEVYELGVTDILEKPFTPYFLKKRIDSVIELYKLKENNIAFLEEKIAVLKTFNLDIIKIFISAINLKNEKLKTQIKDIQILTFKILENLKKENQVCHRKFNDKNFQLLLDIISLYSIKDIGISDEIFEYICNNYYTDYKKNEIAIYIQIINLLYTYIKLIKDESSHQGYSKKEAIKILKNGKYGYFNPLLISILEQID